jgi:hypothetical protein
MGATSVASKSEEKKRKAPAADTVVETPTPQASAGAGAGLPRFFHGTPPVRLRPRGGVAIQRACACGGTCAACRPALLQRSGNGGIGTDLGGAIDARVIPSDSAGDTLPHATQRFLESRMGADLGHVRVHTDRRAADSAATLHADAYTFGRDIYFGAGKYQPESTEGKRLLAHEVTHTLQQSAGPSSVAASTASTVWVGGVHDPAETEADAVAEHVVNGRAAAPIQVTSSAGARSAVRRDVGDYLSSAWDATGGALVDKAREGVEAVEEFAADEAMAIIRRISPGLADIIEEGPIAYAKRRIGEMLDAHLPDWLGGFSLNGLIDGVKGWVSKAVGFIKGLLKGDQKSCDAFRSFMQGLTQFVSGIIDNPVVQFFKEVFGTAADFIGKAIKLVAAPVFDALSGIVGGAWKAIKSVANTISGWISSVRSAIGRAWDWLTGKLGFSDSSEGGVWNWIKGIAGEIWDGIKSAVAPVLGPLRKVATVLVALSPMGPVLALVKYGPKLVKVVQWVWENGLSEAKIREAPAEIQDMLHSLSGGVDGFKDTLHSAFEWLGTQLASLGTTLLEITEAVTGLPLLGFARDLFQDAQVAAQHLIASIQEGASDALQSIEAIAGKIVAFIRPYKEVLSSLILAIASPPMIPLILAGWAWRALPRCVKIPILDFVVDIAIKAITSAPTMIGFGPLWPLIKPALLAFFRTLRAATDETKEKVSNKIAKVISGASPEFLIAFVKGFAVGIWEGITDPIKAIWSVLEGLNAAVEYLERLAGISGEEKPPEQAAQGAPAAQSAPAEQGAPAAPDPQLQQRVSEMADQIGPDVGVVKEGFWDAVQEYFNGSKMSFDDLVDKLSEVWEAAKKKLEEGGAWLSKQLIEFFSGDAAEGELGDKVGWLTGSISFQVLLDIVTAGTAEAVTAAGKILGTIAKFINWPMEVMGEAFKLLSKLGKYVLDILKGLGGAIKEAAGGAFKAVSKALGNIGERLIAFAEEILAKFGGKAGKAEAKAASMLERETADLAQQEAAKAAEKTVSTEAAGKLEQTAAQRTEAEAAHDAEQQAKKKVEEKAGAEEEKGAASDARKQAELAAAEGEAKAIMRADSAVDMPVAGLLGQLMALKLEFRWIQSFDAEPIGPGRYAIAMIASDHPLGEYDVKPPHAPEGATEKPAAPPPRPADVKAEAHLADKQKSVENAKKNVESAAQNVERAKAELAAAQSQGKGIGDAREELEKAEGKLSEANADAEKADLLLQNATAAHGSAQSLQGEMDKLVEQMDAVKRRAGLEGKSWPNASKLDGQQQSLRTEYDWLNDQHHALSQRKIAELDKIEGDWLKKLRGGTPGAGAGKQAEQNLVTFQNSLPAELRQLKKPFDVTNPGKLLSEVSPDHVYPFDKIIREPGFAKLTPAQQKEILELPENYFALTESANKSKGALTMAEWFQTDIGRGVPENLRDPLTKLEGRAQKAIRKRIEDFLTP